MRNLLLLVALLFWLSPAVLGEDLDGIGFYPPGDKPNFSVTIWGPVVNGKVIVNNAYFAPNLLPTTVLLTPTGEKLGIGKEKAGRRMGVNMHVNVNNPGFHASVADMIIYYPYNLTEMPKVRLKVAGDILKADCRRDPREHNVNAVKAVIRLPPAVAKKLKFCDSMMLEVYNSSGILLEQVTLKICDQQAYDAMLADAKKEVLEKSESLLH